MNRVAIDFREIDRCGECSEKWGICGYHQERFGVNWEGKSTMNDIPRRIDLQRNTPAELAIRAAVENVMDVRAWVERQAAKIVEGCGTNSDIQLIADTYTPMITKLAEAARNFAALREPMTCTHPRACWREPSSVHPDGHCSTCVEKRLAVAAALEEAASLFHHMCGQEGSRMTCHTEDCPKCRIQRLAANRAKVKP